MEKKRIEVSNEIPIFPLPNVVFFPKTLLPLHIFEDRYRKMVADALSGSNQIGLALLKEGWDKDYFGSPAVYDIGCVGDIQYSEELDDGKYNVMLYGLCRVKILKFVQEEPYRIAQVKFVNEMKFDYDSFNEDRATEELVLKVRRYLEEMGVKKTDEFLNFETHSLESIVNQVATVLDLSILEKQRLLEKDSLQDRLDALTNLLRDRQLALHVARNVRYAPEDPSWN